MHFLRNALDGFWVGVAWRKKLSANRASIEPSSLIFFYQVREFFPYTVRRGIFRDIFFNLKNKL